MKTKVSEGNIYEVTAPSGGATSGLGLQIGAALFGIAKASVLAGEIAELDAVGVFDHVAEGAGSGQAWAVGDVIYWDNTAKQFTKTTTSNLKAGIAVAAKLTAATTGRLRLVPSI